MEAEIYLNKLTRREFRQRMDSGQLQCCILPVAAVEQHLEHLAMEHDWRSVNEVARRVALRLRPRVVVAQALMVGVSEHHMIHRGTLTLRPGTFLSVLDDLLDSLVRAGFDHILVLNGHGGNIAPCWNNWDQVLRQHQRNIHFLPYWNVLTDDDARELLRSGHRLPEDLPGHAQEFETAVALAAFAENVRRDALRDQPDPTPAMATAETGREFLRRIEERVAQYVEEMIAGLRVAPVPVYHP